MLRPSQVGGPQETSKPLFFVRVMPLPVAPRVLNAALPQRLGAKIRTQRRHWATIYLDAACSPREGGTWTFDPAKPAELLARLARLLQNAGQEVEVWFGLCGDPAWRFAGPSGVQRATPGIRWRAPALRAIRPGDLEKLLLDPGILLQSA